MKNLILLLAIFIASALGLYANAQDAKNARISITGAYSKATVAGQTVGSGFMKIAVTGESDQLIGASTPIATEVQLHSMSMEGNTMKMRQINALEIPTNSSVELTPSGLHLMLMGLKKPLAVGDVVKIKLKFASSGELEVNLPVQAVGAGSMHGH
jgi:copper(I)-binding protein